MGAIAFDLAPHAPIAPIGRAYNSSHQLETAMNAHTYSSGAAVLIALLPILPLMLYLRRRRKPLRKPAFLALGSVSLALLGVGVVLATNHGAF